jgi:cyclopropane-fatty-acyl-phospholipid synthase
MTTIQTLSLPTSIPAAARAVLRALPQLQRGSLRLQLPDGAPLHFGAAGAMPRATLRLHNWKPCAAVLRSGDIGAAETYIAGDWSTPDLRALLNLFVANRDALDGLVYGRPARWRARPAGWGSTARRGGATGARHRSGWSEP